MVLTAMVRKWKHVGAVGLFSHAFQKDTRAFGKDEMTLMVADWSKVQLVDFGEPARVFLHSQSGILKVQGIVEGAFFCLSDSAMYPVADTSYDRKDNAPLRDPEKFKRPTFTQMHNSETTIGLWSSGAW
jgi:hypothetical protein